MTTASSITTAAGLLEAGDIGRCELVDGELVMMSPANPRHGQVTIRVGSALHEHVESRKLGAVFAAETGFLLHRNPDTVRAPDAAFVHASRMHLIPERGFFPGPPDLAVEVLSPDDSAGEVLAKVTDWLKAGTKAVWIVDPQRRTVAVYQGGAAVRMLTEQDELSDESLLPGFRVRVRDLFP